MRNFKESNSNIFQLLSNVKNVVLTCSDAFSTLKTFQTLHNPNGKGCFLSSPSGAWSTQAFRWIFVAFLFLLQFSLLRFVAVCVSGGFFIFDYIPYEENHACRNLCCRYVNYANYQHVCQTTRIRRNSSKYAQVTQKFYTPVSGPLELDLRGTFGVTFGETFGGRAGARRSPPVR